LAEPAATSLLRTRWVLLGTAAVILIAHSLAYNFVTDDAYISFVFSRNFAEHGELTFNLGHPVEGYTNFLWTLVLGLVMLVGIPPEWSSRVLGTACALATLYVAFRLMERALGKKTPWAAVPPLLLVCSSGFACWTSGGLETQLFTLLVTAALDAFVAAASSPRALRRLGVMLALASMTRPEGPMIAAVFGASWAVLRGVPWIADRLAARRGHLDPAAGLAPVPRPRRLADEALAVAWFLGLWAPWFGWRWWYYGWPFPNTYYVKATGPWASPDLPRQMIGNGLYYVWTWLRQTHLLYALPVAALGLIAARPRTPRFASTVACTLLAIVYLAYTVSVGGDFMGLHRFIMPMFVVAAVAVTLGAEWIASKLSHRAATPAVAAVLVGAFAVTQGILTRESLRWGNFGSDRGIDTPAYLIAYTEDRATIGRTMAGCFRADDFSIVGGAGAQPYFGRMRGVDVFGLVSETIAHDEPRIRARAGHTKFGADRVLAAYDPTFVFSCYQIHQQPEQPALPCSAFWLARGFEPVTMHIPGMRERGEYYTFLAKKARNFQCPGRVH
jgi:arabinofuranosyltransferase